MKMTYYAHSSKASDRSDWQLLKEHLQSVATLAAATAEPIGLERAAYIAGLFHDLGKYAPDFQRRLAGEDIRVDHSTAGAKLLLDMTSGADKMMAEIIAYAILGHHAGLPDRRNETAACFDSRIKPAANVDPVWQKELAADVTGLAPAMLSGFRTGDAGFALSVMGRMIFSCLVDADFKDTEQFYHLLEGRIADRAWLPLQDLLGEFTERFDAHMQGFAGKAGELNRLRAEILAHVRARAAEEPGLFTLTVPTGGGKTLASLGFALDHARAHGLSRIIYAIPFTSIIDQTAAIFRDLLGEDHVLEHHSAIDEEKFGAGRKEDRQQKDKLKLAMEDWAAPVVVTTNVQLFESLFSARPSRARKLHNIAGSVIILDEAQTLPRHLLTPVMRMLEELAENYRCSIVLCTATQPALARSAQFPRGLPLDGSRELAPDPHGLAAKLARATIRHAGAMDNEALLQALESTKQALVIVNSRRHALELFREAQAAGLDGLVHLTTRQYAAHRRQILEKVRTRLKLGQPCRVIATSLVEAGVDVDFPRVWRAEAGLDQIIQAAGRCNREGRRPRSESVVTVFVAPDYPPPSEIRGLIGDMKRIIGKHDDLLSLPAIADYFGEVYWRMADQLDGKEIVSRLSLSRIGTDFAYRAIGEDFRMIESSLVPVIVARDEEAKKAVADLRFEAIPSGVLARKLQSCIVQIPPKARDILIRNGHAAFIRPDLRGDQFAVLQTASLYGEDVGLLWENAEYLGVENMFM